MAGKRMDPIASEADLAAVALKLGAESVGRLTAAESAIAGSAGKVNQAVEGNLRRRIRAGEDPLGDAFCTLRSAATRREQGAVYTPIRIVKSMVDWSMTIAVPDRIVEPGAGSGRFLLEAGRRFRKAELIAVETDPLAALICRANLAVAGLARRASVRLEDFRSVELDEIDGRTLYIGNPPYVRHHQIDQMWKRWLKQEAACLGLKASALAGLHVHFFLAIALRAKPGDVGTLVTAAEWLDVNYGQLVRDLFLGRLGGQGVSLIAPDAEPFPGTQATAAITSFAVDDPPKSARFSRVDGLHKLNGLECGRVATRREMESASRWSSLVRKPRKTPRGYIELGELCRVHRGQVTGANRVWIAGEHSASLPEEVLVPCVTKARELIANGSVLCKTDTLRRVIDLPVDFSGFSSRQRASIEQFLECAEQMGARDTYIAQHRKAWWSVGLREPAPILATYMARRPPVFVRNSANARHLNIAHGLYPREPMSEGTLRGLVRYLSEAGTVDGGRVYAGGLTKFEPREMERIPVPRPEMLETS